MLMACYVLYCYAVAMMYLLCRFALGQTLGMVLSKSSRGSRIGRKVEESGRTQILLHMAQERDQSFLTLATSEAPCREI